MNRRWSLVLFTLVLASIALADKPIVKEENKEIDVESLPKEHRESNDGGIVINESPKEVKPLKKLPHKNVGHHHRPHVRPGKYPNFKLPSPKPFPRLPSLFKKPLKPLFKTPKFLQRPSKTALRRPPTKPVFNKKPSAPVKTVAVNSDSTKVDEKKKVTEIKKQTVSPVKQTVKTKKPLEIKLPYSGRPKRKIVDKSFKRDTGYSAPTYSAPAPAAPSYSAPKEPEIIIKQAGPSQTYDWIGHGSYGPPTIPDVIPVELTKWDPVNDEVFETGFIFENEGAAPAAPISSAPAPVSSGSSYSSPSVSAPVSSSSSYSSPAAPAVPEPVYTGSFSSPAVPAPVSSGSSYSSPVAQAPVSSGSSYSSPVAPAPVSSGSSYSSPVAPAPVSSGSSYSSPAAPAPVSSGSSYSSPVAPAPVSSGSFYASPAVPAPAPVSSGSSYSSPAAPAPAPVSAGSSYSPGNPFSTGSSTSFNSGSSFNSQQNSGSLFGTFSSAQSSSDTYNSPPNNVLPSTSNSYSSVSSSGAYASPTPIPDPEPVQPVEPEIPNYQQAVKAAENPINYGTFSSESGQFSSSNLFSPTTPPQVESNNNYNAPQEPIETAPVAQDDNIPNYVSSQTPEIADYERKPVQLWDPNTQQFVSQPLFNAIEEEEQQLGAEEPSVSYTREIATPHDAYQTNFNVVEGLGTVDDIPLESVVGHQQKTFDPFGLLKQKRQPVVQDQDDQVFYVFYENGDQDKQGSQQVQQTALRENDFQTTNTKAKLPQFVEEPENSQFTPPDEEDIRTIYVPLEHAINVPESYTLSLASSFGYDQNRKRKEEKESQNEAHKKPIYRNYQHFQAFPNFPLSQQDPENVPSYDNPISSYDAPILDTNSYTANVHRPTLIPSLVSQSNNAATAAATPGRRTRVRKVRRPAKNDVPSNDLVTEESELSFGEDTSAKENLDELPQKNLPFGTRIRRRKPYHIIERN